MRRVKTEWEFALAKSILPEEIHALRKRLGLTQRDFGTLLGVSSKSVERWEAEDKPVTGPVVALARILWEYPQIVTRLQVPKREMPHRFWFCWRDYRCTLIDADVEKRRIQVKDFTLDHTKKAFGVVSRPSYEDFEELVAVRCGIGGGNSTQLKSVLKENGLTEYDPMVILRNTQGRLPDDEFSLIMEE